MNHGLNEPEARQIITSPMAGALVFVAACGMHLGGVSPVLRHAPRVATPRAVAVPFSRPAADDESSKLKILYDGQCMVCLTNKALLTFFDWRKEKRLDFVNIRDDNYSPSKNGGVSYADAMRHFHVLDGDHVAEGSEAVLLAYSRVGLGWLMAVLRFPLIRWFIDRLYAVVSKHRYSISRILPGGKALASAVTSLHDVESAAMGLGCEDEEECMLDYGDEDDEDE